MFNLLSIKLEYDSTNDNTMTNGLVFDESVASGIFNTTVETIAEKPSSTPQHVPVNTESIDLSIISWSETTLTRNQKKNYRKCGRNLRKNKKVCIENYYFMNIHNILTYFFFQKYLDSEPNPNYVDTNNSNQENIWPTLCNKDPKD